MQKCLSSGQPGLCEGQKGHGDKGEKEERLRWTKNQIIKNPVEHEKETPTSTHEFK